MNDRLSTRIFVAGHQGMVGSAILRRLQSEGYNNLILKSHSQLDLMDRPAVDAFFSSESPDWVFLAAARVGGIIANRDYPAEFIYDNLSIQNNVIDSAYRYGAEKLCFLGSSCIYPRDAKQPLTEDALLSGPLEETNQWYAIAKITGIKLCQAYRRQYGFDAISLMPTNLYGPGDNFDLEKSHVLPALLRKFYEAVKNDVKEVVIWGSGRPRREFLYVDDLADACLFAMRNYSEEGILNVGMGEDISISELAELVAEITGYTGRLVYDESKPDGTPRKLLDVSKLKSLGWSPVTSLKGGISSTYQWYQDNLETARGL